MTRFYLTVLICSLAMPIMLINTAEAQQSSILRVLVTSNEDGRPVINAHVILQSVKDGEVSEQIAEAGVTDTDGFVELRGISPGRYRLTVSYIGYKRYIQQLTFQTDEILVKQISLQAAVEKLDRVIVKERRESSGEAGIQRISGDDLGRIPSVGPSGDLTSYLQTLPGVVTTGDRGGNLYIRGGTPEQNKILVDNLPVIKPFHISNLFSAFPEENIQSVDMYAGGFGSEYLGATSAVIDATLKTGNMRSHEQSVFAGSHMVGLHAEGPLNYGKESYLLSARKSLINLTSPYLSTKESDINFYDVTGRYTYQSNNFYCNVTAMRTFDRGAINQERNLSLSWSNLLFGGRCRGFDDYYNHPFTVTAGYSRYKNSESSLEHEERSSIIEQLVIKMELEEEYMGYPFFYGFGMRFRTVKAQLDEPFVQNVSFSNLNIIPYAYINMKIEPGKYFVIKPGLAMQSTWGVAPSLEPRFRMAWYPGGKKDREFSLAVGRYTQDINGLTDQRDAGTTFMLWKPVDPGKSTQKAYHAILHYRQRLGEALTFNLETYVKAHRSISVAKWTPQAGMKTEAALADGSAYGFDIRMRYDTPSLYTYVGYGWSKVKYSAATDNLGAWIDAPVFEYYPPHDQRHKLNAIVAYRWNGYSFNAGWEFGSGKPYTRVLGFDLSLRSIYSNPLHDPGTARTLYSKPYGARLPTYHRLDASVERTFRLSDSYKLKAKAGCINLYDRRNIFYYDLNNLHRVNQSPVLPYFSVTLNID